MSKAGIEKVREAEIAAENARKTAEDQADQLVAAGKKEARELIADAERRADKDYRLALEAAEKVAAERYQALIDSQAQACEKIKSEGRSRIDGVVDEIVGKVVGIYGNS